MARKDVSFGLDRKASSPTMARLLAVKAVVTPQIDSKGGSV
jgi:hypothetical protein